MVKFLRRTWSRYSKLGKGRKKKQIWRRPTGRDNKMREKRKGYPARVSIGYKTAKEELKKIIKINNLNDLDKVQKQDIIILGKMGQKKKIEIAKKAKEKKIEISNLNIEKFLESIKKKAKLKAKPKETKKEGAKEKKVEKAEEKKVEEKEKPKDGKKMEKKDAKPKEKNEEENKK